MLTFLLHWDKTPLHYWITASASTAVLLASLACQLGSDKCITFSTNVKNLLLDQDFQANVEHSTRLAAVSVACHLGSQVNDTTMFDTMVVSNKPQTTATNQEAPLLLRLAFAACVPKGAADTSVSAIAQEALDGRLSAAEADQVRVFQHLRKEVLAQLSKIQTVPTQDDFTRTLNNLAVLHIVRTSEELQIVMEYARRSTFNALATDPPMKDIVDGVVVHAQPFQTLPAIQTWINNQP